MDAPVELRQLRYFVAVAEELHFGRAAERLQMTQSPLSRSIRELERELGVTLFVRTTRRVELTAAGATLLERSRRALAEIDGAIADARRSAERQEGVLSIGYGPFSRTVATQIAEEMKACEGDVEVRLEEEVTPESLRRIPAHDLSAAVVMESPAAARRHGVRIDTLRDEPLLAALPPDHEYADGGAIPVAAFSAETVLLPREPTGRLFNAWFRTVVRAVGFELEHTLLLLSAPWDRRLLPVADGEAVSVIVEDWRDESTAGVAAVPFDPPLSFPTDFASCWPPSDAISALVETVCRTRDQEGWLTQRPVRTDVPD